MPQTVQKYVLTPRHQFIDLNKELINFKLDFQVVASNPSMEFEVLVVEQKQLDSMDIKNLQMKKVKGKIGGSIQANKNEYKNYFLVVKSFGSENLEAEVIVNLEEIDALPQPPVEAQTPPPQPNISQAVAQTTTPQVIKIPFYKQTWFYILLVGIIVGAALYWYLYIRKGATEASEHAPLEPAATEPDLYGRISRTVREVS